MAGEMQWLKRDALLRRDTRLPHRGARSAIVVALDYGGREPAGTVARYARGRDYHGVMKERLYALLRWLETDYGSRVRGRPYVDTGPILERDLARLAGLGWFGKNTMLIHPRRGSFLFLGALFVDAELEPDAPFEEEHCGTCRRCIDACPTTAIADEGVLDATRCISYLTIEKRGAIRWSGAPRSGPLSTVATSARTSARGTSDSRVRRGIPTSPPEALRHLPIPSRSCK
jgi:epoxyqueuosine reductase